RVLGIAMEGARSRVAPTTSRQLEEFVGGTPGRLWNYQVPSGDAHRHATTIAAFADDRIAFSSRVTLEGGLRFESIAGAAAGAIRGIRWQTWLPRSTLGFTISRTANLVARLSYRRSALQLPLNMLAIGDPAAPTADVSRWNGSTVGPLIARVGPGTGNDPTFTQIDALLKRPTTDEVVMAIESRPAASLRLQFSAILKKERDFVRLIDRGVPSSAYGAAMVTDPDIADSPGHVLPIYIRPTESFGQDSYPLTNGGSGAATFSGIDITVQASTVHWLVLVGGTASRGIGPAAGVGFQATENDQDAMGSLFTDPNAQTYARGRLFVDRAYTGKVTTVFRLPGEFSIGAVARYQDGQPFARLIIEPDVPQGPVR